MNATFSSLDTNQAQAIDELNAQVARMNEAVKRAVDAGLIIEITRGSRLHCPQFACWGDQMKPQISTAGNHL